MSDYYVHVTNAHHFDKEWLRVSSLKTAICNKFGRISFTEEEHSEEFSFHEKAVKKYFFRRLENLLGISISDHWKANFLRFDGRFPLIGLDIVTMEPRIKHMSIGTSRKRFFSIIYFFFSAFSLLFILII